jgi:hypothetical protein
MTSLLDYDSKNETDKVCHTSRVKCTNRHFSKMVQKLSPVGGNTYNKTPVLTVPICQATETKPITEHDPLLQQYPPLVTGVPNV